jgi:hypothetical protein
MSSGDDIVVGNAHEILIGNPHPQQRAAGLARLDRQPRPADGHRRAAVQIEFRDHRGTAQMVRGGSDPLSRRRRDRHAIRLLQPGLLLAGYDRRIWLGSSTTPLSN